MERYENPRLLATAHIEKLFTFTPLTKESVSWLSLFMNTFRENVAAIKASGINDFSGFVLFYIGARAIDPTTRLLFEANVSQYVVPDLETLLSFVSQRCTILENVGSNVPPECLTKSVVKRSKGWSPGKTSLATAASNKSDKCKFCHRDHLVHRCFLLRKKSVVFRRKFVAKNRLCFLCLKTDHIANAYTSTLTCQQCSGRHHTLIHYDSKLPTVNNKVQNVENNENTEIQTTDRNAQFVGATHAEPTMLLGTAIVRVGDNSGVLQPIRVLLDSGSQVSAMTSYCDTRLGLPQTKNRTDIRGLTQQPVTKIKGATRCTFLPMQTDQPEFKAHNVIILTHKLRRCLVQYYQKKSVNGIVI